MSFSSTLRDRDHKNKKFYLFLIYTHPKWIEVDQTRLDQMNQSGPNWNVFVLDPFKKTIGLTYVISQVINLVKLKNLG